MTKNIFFIITLTLFIASNLFASESRLYLLHADSSLGKLVEGEKVRYLVGNVKARQDTINIECDLLVYYEERDIAEFIGNVLIDDSHHKLRADKIVYYTESRTAHCNGHVRISGINDSLYAEKFIYQFRGGSAWAEDNLFIWDKQNNARVRGDAGEYIADLQESHIRGNAHFEHHEPGQSDTLLITSKNMAYFGTEPKRAVAEDSVRIFKGGVKASCDSATYFTTDEKVILRVNPVAWQGDSEMTGEKIDFTLDSLKIDEIFLIEKAQIKSLADTLENTYNILKGKTIQVTMVDGTPDKIVARRNAISVYQIEENKINQGTNSASSDSIIVYFKTGELDSISIIGGTEGIFYPAEWKGEIKSDY
jgi:lipopolysaccharide export system protein LptA